MMDIVGWKSRVTVAMATAHRIVLQGNVLDVVLDENHHAVRLPEWLVAHLRRAGYRRIVFFDHGSDPVIHEWDGSTAQEGLAALMQLGGGQAIPRRRSDPSDPLVVLGRLHYMLADSNVSSACILTLQEQRFRFPSEEAVALHRLTRAAAIATDTSVPEGVAGQADAVLSGSSLRNLAILLYADENLIPGEFLRTDPDSALIRIPFPSFSERAAYFRHNKQIFFKDDSSTYDAHELARITEGARLLELQQLADLSTCEKVGVESLNELQGLLHFGKRENPWFYMGDRARAEDILNPIRGQKEARGSVVDALRQGKWDVGGMIDPGARQPPLVLFFVGGTGVGKTMMARHMAQFLTGSADGLKVIDMSEYRQDHSVQRLIGAPPSYIGFSEGGQLTNWVKERPFSLVLFDEIEKAHERILDIFLQILDGARLTDGKGETVDFSHTGLIFTSNIGTDALADGGINRSDRQQVVDFFIDQVREFFEDIERPEIYNRLKSGIVVFNFIRREDAAANVADKLKAITENVNQRLRGGGSIIDADQKIVENLLAHTNFEKYGLRDVNNALKTRLGSAIASFLDVAQQRSFTVRGTYCYRWDEIAQQVEIVKHEP